VREVLETNLPEKSLIAEVQPAGFQTREFKLGAYRLLGARVISAATGDGGRQADVMRLCFDSDGEQVVRGGFCRWFGTPLESRMEDVSRRARPSRGLARYSLARPWDIESRRFWSCE